ncbi:hypothetical protein ACIBI9_10620 [Nonomuraea sp. NPDC050451]
MGLVVVWPAVFGATLITLGRLWRIDRLGQLYLTHQDTTQNRPCSPR